MSLLLRLFIVRLHKFIDVIHDFLTISKAYETVFYSKFLELDVHYLTIDELVVSIDNQPSLTISLPFITNMTQKINHGFHCVWYKTTESIILSTYLEIEANALE